MHHPLCGGLNTTTFVAICVQPAAPPLTRVLSWCDVSPGALDLAELLAFRELKMGAPQMGVPRSKRAMLLLDASRQQLRKQWAELAPAPTKPQMIETPIAAMPTPTVEDSNDVSASGEPVVSPVVEAAAAEAAVTAAFGVVTEVDTKEGLAAVINANPGKMVCLMIGFTFCRPCKAFVRPYEVRPASSLPGHRLSAHIAPRTESVEK